jgi:3-oxoadipate enol-lactonase
MPLIYAGGIQQYYRLNGLDDRPTLVLCHSLGCDHTMWDPQAAALESRFRILRYDTRGHGATEATPGEYTVALLAQDLLALVDALDIDRFVLCGLSLGGMIGQWLGANAPDRLNALILANTTSRLNDPSMLETRRQTVLQHGMSAVTETVLSRFFTAERFKTLPAVMNVRRVLRGTNPIGYAGACAALRDLNQTALLDAIRVPTLIIAGDYDVPVPWVGNGDVLVQHLPHAMVEHLPAAHISNLECPEAFTSATERLVRKTLG